RGTMRIPADRDPTLAGGRTPALAKLSLDQRQLAWQFGIAPIPNDQTRKLSGRDDETDEMLEAIGYVDPEKPAAENPAENPAPHEGAEAAPPAPMSPCEPPRKP